MFTYTAHYETFDPRRRIWTAQTLVTYSLSAAKAACRGRNAMVTDAAGTVLWSR